ncbi:uncharacterized protein LOC126099316 [Schistocerca cancellata]|uniref:uncharacterized protein LOC126099316 n=1 Tax=Schistocerca cancellata TaxID=274614 RepID=UPI00211885AB|nr:uncharacterized protein LOC126099316 [Schistocerca cancellata]
MTVDNTPVRSALREADKRRDVNETTPADYEEVPAERARFAWKLKAVWRPAWRSSLLRAGHGERHDAQGGAQHASAHDLHRNGEPAVSRRYMICCICGVLLTPLHGECWQRSSTALQMAASGGYGLIAVGRLFALLGGDLLPLAIERLYVWAAAMLFAACGGVSLASAATGDSAWGPTDPWETREVARAALALLVTIVLVADAITCHLPAGIVLDVPPRISSAGAPAADDSPPPYSVVIAHEAGLLP